MRMRKLQQQQLTITTRIVWIPSSILLLLLLLLSLSLFENVGTITIWFVHGAVVSGGGSGTSGLRATEMNSSSSTGTGTTATNNIDNYHPQQTCKPWTTPGYRSLSRSLEGASVGNINDIIDKHTEETNTIQYVDYEHEDSGSGSCGWEPNLQPMNVQFANGYNETFYAYIPPDVSILYNQTRGTIEPNKSTFTGRIVKFINMSPSRIQIYWQSTSTSSITKDKTNYNRVYITDIEPFGSASTASYPKHTFVAVPKQQQQQQQTMTNNIDKNDKNNDKVLIEWIVLDGDVTNNNNNVSLLYYYDPYNMNINDAKKDGLTDSQIFLYHIQLVNLAFAQQYKLFTGIDWLGVYKHRQPPRYHMWRCDYIGQSHSIDTNEIHYTELPPDDELHRSTSVYGPRPHELDRMRKYKATYPVLNLTLTALSCAPRVFEILNFLSDIEINHLLYLAKKSIMHPSRTATGTTTGETSSTGKADTTTRSSHNTWIARNSDMITDAIYRRAADVLQIHEALLRWRRPTEIPEFPESMISISESLQLVHYAVGQEYTPHHDFSMPAMVKDQPARFATILFYLNDDMEGGETTFPRWLNAESTTTTTTTTQSSASSKSKSSLYGEPLTVKPQRGKAILFYNMLPDGNFDERSQHAAMKVTKGEKYLTNLWVWDPILDHTIAKHL